MYNANYMSTKLRWHNDDKLVALQEDVDLAALKQFAPLLLKRAFSETLIHGNMSKNNAESILLTFEKSLGIHPLRSGELTPTARCVKFPGLAGAHHIHRQAGPDPENPESSIKTDFQLDPNGHPSGYGGFTSELEMTAALSLLSHLMKEPCYDILRTKEQLGYMVWSGASRNNGVGSLWFIIQSPEKGPAMLDNRVEAFLEHFYENVLKNMTEETFTSNVQACVLTRTKKDVSLYHQSDRFWKQVENQSYLFNRSFDMAKALESLKHEQIIGLFERYVKKDGSNRNKLTAQIVGKGREEIDRPLFEAQVAAGATVVGGDIASMDQFKARCSLFPAVGEN